jgi:acetyl-CoA acetyltransferase
MIARRHMHEYGTTPEHLASVAVIMRDHARLTGRAHHMGPLSVEDVLASPMIADPFHRLDCSLVSDGAGAIVVTSLERARHLRKPPIAILGIGEAYTHERVSNSPSLTSFGGKDAAARAYEMAGVGPNDIEVAGIYDCFTGVLLIELEDFGFCEPGAAGPFVAGGGIRIGGKLPVNTHGGLLSYCHPGYPGGIFHVIEVARQLRGEAAGRQVRCDVGFANSMGGVFAVNSAAVLGTERAL